LFQQSGLHVAIIMDGNGRWALRRALPRTAGHAAGAHALRSTVEEAARHPDVGTLTCFAFSSDNWRRPPEEVESLMRLFGDTLRSERPRCCKNGVRLSVIGRRDRLATPLLREIERTEQATASGTHLHLRLAVDYSARASLQQEGAPTGPDVDLLIRPGGERRLSDFLLYESAYAELLFLDKLWPDFSGVDLREALDWFASRHRRFGGLGAA
jgi:undecaprenyl diphosphate synthase